MKYIFIIFFLVFSIALSAVSPEILIAEYLKVDLDSLNYSAWQAYQDGQYEDAASYYLEYLKYDINNGSACYNLACTYGLLGNEELAAEFLELSYQKGFKDLEHIKNDADFDLVRESDKFQSVIEKLAKLEENKINFELYNLKTEYLADIILQMPINYDCQKTYPMIVGLHGYGAVATNFIELFRDYSDHIVAVPETAYPFPVGKEIGYSWTYHGDNEKPQINTFLLSSDYIAQLIKALKNEYKISDVYLVGFSQGAGLSYLTGIRHHDIIDAIAPFGGWLDTEMLSNKEIQKASDLSIFIAHGVEDRVVEIGSAHQAFKFLTEQGYLAKLHEFDGAHSVPKEVLKQAIDWMQRPD